MNRTAERAGLWCFYAGAKTAFLMLILAGLAILAQLVIGIPLPGRLARAAVIMGTASQSSPTTEAGPGTGGAIAAHMPDILEFEKEIANENEVHEQFIERMDARLEDDAIKLFAAIAAVFAGIFAWFEYQTRSGMRKHIESKIMSMVDPEVKRQLEEFSNQMAEIKLQVTQISSIMTRQSQINDVVSESLDTLAIAKKSALSEDDKQAIEETIALVERNLRVTPASRALAIQLGRLMDECKHDAIGALKALESTVKARTPPKREDERKEWNEDQGALFYNIACYKNQVRLGLIRNGKEAEQPQYIAELKTGAEEAIANSIRLDPQNRTEANQDKDLAGLSCYKPVPDGSTV
jgi:hypothetical protein